MIDALELLGVVLQAARNEAMLQVKRIGNRLGQNSVSTGRCRGFTPAYGVQRCSVAMNRFQCAGQDRSRISSAAQEDDRLGWIAQVSSDRLSHQPAQFSLQ